MSEEQIEKLAEESAQDIRENLRVPYKLGFHAGFNKCHELHAPESKIAFDKHGNIDSPMIRGLKELIEKDPDSIRKYFDESKAHSKNHPSVLETLNFGHDPKAIVFNNKVIDLIKKKIADLKTDIEVYEEADEVPLYDEEKKDLKRMRHDLYLLEEILNPE